MVLRRAPSKVDFFNSTELRHVLSESDVPMTMGAEGQTRTWRLPRKAEAEGRSWCRYLWGSKVGSKLSRVEISFSLQLAVRRPHHHHRRRRLPLGYNCNDKGSVVPEMLMSHLKFVNKVRAAKGRPDAWVMMLLDGVGTHVTAEMLEFFAINKLILGLRPPNTSHAVQNEDLVTFWCVVEVANI